MNEEIPTKDSSYNTFDCKSDNDAGFVSGPPRLGSYIHLFNAFQSHILEPHAQAPVRK